MKPFDLGLLEISINHAFESGIRLFRLFHLILADTAVLQGT